MRRLTVAGKDETGTEILDAPRFFCAEDYRQKSLAKESRGPMLPKRTLQVIMVDNRPAASQVPAGERVNSYTKSRWTGRFWPGGACRSRPPRAYFLGAVLFPGSA